MLKRCLVLIFCWTCLSASAVAAAETCNIDVINEVSYRKILDYLLITSEDVKLYKKIFRSVEAGDFTTAQRYTDKLENHIILGHVLAEKYLHPKYKATYQELKDWLEQYSDLPSAVRIYRLALRKGAAAGLPQPQKLSDVAHIRGWDNRTIEHLTPADRQYLSSQVQKFTLNLNKGRTKAARQVLEQGKFRRLAPNRYWDEMAASLALKYFVDNYNRLAFEWGVRAAKRKTSAVAPWVAGLSAWKQKDYKTAARYFEQLARLKKSDDWLVAAGGYWASRAYYKLNREIKAQQMLGLSAVYKHTFYGLLAGYKLGEKPGYNWDAVTFQNNFQGSSYVYDLLESPQIRRAVILIHAKRPDLAEAELRHGFAEMSPKQREATIYLANQYQMHSLAIYACNENKNHGQRQSYDGVAYPIPRWLPEQGWKVEKALVLALVRQESAFEPEALSSAGARGLMQLMPNTAYHITQDKTLRRDAVRLFETEFNLDLGQRYVDYLMSKPFVNGNLFFMATAYNAGPGNLAKWQKTTRYEGDPLLFIEMIPSAQTRIYIERVLANYWIYNMRFGIPNLTLRQVAAGEWPVLKRQ